MADAHSAPRYFPANHTPAELRGCPCFMMFPDFLNRLRAALVECCGLTSDEALHYTTHGVRAAAATSLVKADVALHIINTRAGTVTHNWVADYDRVDLPRRLDASRALMS